MNVTTRQEKEKNEKTKTGKRKTGEERKQATDFKEAVCCPSAVVQGAARQKNGLCEGSARGNRDPRGRPTAISTQAKRDSAMTKRLKSTVLHLTQVLISKKKNTE